MRLLLRSLIYAKKRSEAREKEKQFSITEDALKWPEVLLLCMRRSIALLGNDPKSQRVAALDMKSASGHQMTTFHGHAHCKVNKVGKYNLVIFSLLQSRLLSSST